MELDGRIALVTGGAQGIGAAIGQALADAGAHVTLVDRQESVRSVAASLDGAAHVGDVADAEFVHAVVAGVVAEHGTIDVLVNNAGEAWSTGPRDDWDRAEADFDRLIGSNLKGHFLFGRAVAPAMIAQGSGHIVNVSTDHVKPAPGLHRHHGHGRMDLYNAAKWAINGLTFDWARALERDGIRVNNICMGATDTAMLRGFLRDEPPPEEVATWMRPEQIAAVVVELIEEGPDGRTANSIGLYVGHPCELPPPE